MKFCYMIMNKELWQLPKSVGDVHFHERLSNQSISPSICALGGHVSTSISAPSTNHEHITDLNLEDPVNESPSKTSVQVQPSEDVKGSNLASLFSLEVKSSLFPLISHRD